MKPIYWWFRWGVVVLLAAGIAAARQSAGVLTWHGDIARDGADLSETILTPANVNASSFGKLFSLPIDGDVYAEPLYLPNVSIPGQGTHNVLYVATEHDSVYAFDADSGSQTPLWQVSFVAGRPGVRPIHGVADVQCGDLVPEIGITGTPVIDPSTGTLYVVSASWENGTIIDRLHALDVSTGAEKFGGPVVLAASVPGTGAGSVNGMVSFNAADAQQRPGLLLLNGTVYLAFASFCDGGTYHGWILGYSASTLALQYAFTPTPNDADGGIWQGGVGLASDGTSIYTAVGNGGFDANTGGSDYGESLLRLSPQLQVQDWFTPDNFAYLNQQDLDLGSGGPILVQDPGGPNPNLVMIQGKDSVLYVLNRDHLGGYQASSNSQAVQSLAGAFQSVYGGFAWWNHTLYGGGVFRWSETDVPKALTLSQGQLAISSQASAAFGYPGVTPSISANGATNGIMWGVQTDAYQGTNPSGGPAVLHAWDATNLATELYNSAQSGARDQMGQAIKFAVPTIANGHVYVGTRDEVDVFGLLQGFTAWLTPPVNEVAAGVGLTLTLNTAAVSAASPLLTLSCQAPASGCQVSPTSIAPGQTAMVTIAPTALLTGLNRITVAASGGGLTRLASAWVTADDAATTLQPPQISNITSTGFTVNWNTSQPLNSQVWYGTVSPSTETADWSLTTTHSITLSGLQPATAYQVATESSYFTTPDLLSPAITVTTAASAPDFALALNPAASAVQGGNGASFNLTTTGLNGDLDSLTLTCTAPASGCQILPQAVLPGDSALVTIAAGALQNGLNPVVVSAADGSLTHTAAASVTQLAAPAGLPIPAITAITPTSFTLAWNTAQTLNSQVWYGTTSPATQLANWKLVNQHTVTVTGLQPATSYQVQAESSYFSNPDLLSPVFSLTTSAATATPDFSLGISPTASLVSSGSDVTLNLETTGLNGDNATLNVSCAAPAGGCQISPTSFAPGQSATLTVPAAALEAGSNTIVAQASDGTLAHTAAATITVSGAPLPDFSLALSPLNSTVAPGVNATLTLNSTALGGDTALLGLSCVVPAGGCQVSPASISPGQSAAVSIASTALVAGLNAVTVTGSDGTNQHSTSGTVTVSATPPGLPLPQVTDLTSTSFTLSWTTTQALNTQVWYGVSTPSTEQDNWSLVTQHTLTVTGLLPGTTYEVMAESSYFSNPDLFSAVFQVTTLP